MDDTNTINLSDATYPFHKNEKIFFAVDENGKLYGESTSYNDELERRKDIEIDAMDSM